MSGFEVMAERCDQCLFGPNPVVRPGRRQEILREINRSDSHFVCHKASLARGGTANVCCRGDYDRNPCRTNLMRVMGRLGAVNFVAEEDL